DENDLVEKFVAFDAVPQNGGGSAAIGLPLGRGQRLIQDVMEQRGFSRARDAGDRHQHVERNFQINVLQVVRTGAGDAEFMCPWLPASRWNLDVKFAGEVTAGERVRHL